jgi:hypothetical protein
MAHPTREQFLPPLLDRLGLDENGVVWDQRNDRWDTGRRSMLAYDPQATHHLVVQDDAVVPDDLLEGVRRAADHVPADSPMCLYMGKTRKFWNALARTGTRMPPTPAWVTMPQIHWGVGIVMPTHLIDPMVAWGDLHREVANYDKRMSRWCESKGLTVWYPWPSLVDHRESPSLVAGRQSRGRRAQRFIGEQASALGQDWDRPVIHLPPFTADLRSQRRVNGPEHLPSSMAGQATDAPARPRAVRPVRRMPRQPNRRHR